MIRLRTLGGLAVTPEPPSGAPQPRRLALLARLAHAGEVGVSRDILVAQLWPDTESGRARHALTQTLYGLKRDLNADLVLGTGSLRLNPQVISSDVDDFRVELKRGDRQAAVAVYGGEFLPGFYVRDADEFERWVEETRAELGRDYRRALESLAQEAEGEGRLQWLQRLGSVEPLDSRTALRVAQLQADLGSPAVALKSLQAHEELVSRELGAPVGKEVTAMMQRLSAEAAAQQVERARRPPVARTPEAPSGIRNTAQEEEAPAPLSSAQRQFRKPRRRVILSVAAIMVAGFFGVRALRANTSGVDPQKYVVLPFRHPPGTTDELLSGANCAQLVSSMMEEWKDVRRVDPLRVASALEQAGHPTSLEAILALARSLGAGRVIWGEVNPVGDSIRVRGAVFDSRRRDADPLREAGFSLAGTLAGSPALSVRELGIGFANLTRELIVPGARNAAEAGVGLGTSYSLALEAKLRGDSALSQWNLPLAREAYLRALAVDPVFPQANLSLAQLEQWDGSPRDKWRPYLVTAMVAPARLSAGQLERAHALMAMADEEYPKACERYRGMIVKDSSNFLAWYGLGECQAEDHFLVADAKSPAGWRFRSSYHSAITAYSKALKLVPLTSSAFGGAALSRLVDRFYADPNRMRDGYIGGDRSRVLLAFAGLARDTLVFWPSDPEKVLNGDIRFPTQDQAVRAAREALLSVTSAWVTALPRSVPALQAQATALELARGVGGVSGDSALKLLRNARKLAAPARQFGLGFQSVGVLLKQSKYQTAAALADTLLRPGRFDDADVEQAAILSALRGRVEQTATLMAEDAIRDTLYTPEGEAVDVPLRVRQVSQRLLTYVAFGLPADSIKALRDQIIAATVPLADTAIRRKVQDAALQRATLLAFPLLGAPIDLGNVWSIENGLARGDSTAAMAEFARIASLRQGSHDLTPADATLLEARLRLMAGDSVGARAQLAAFLDRLDVVGMSLIPRMEHAASLGRILMLDASISGNDRSQSAHNAKVLWAEPR